MKNPRLVSLCTVAAALALAAGSAIAFNDVTVGPGGSSLTLTSGQVFHESTGPIDNFRSISVPGTRTIAYLWNESGKPFYAISRDGGNSIAGRVRETDYTIKLAYANFDPLEFIPGVNKQLEASATSELHLVQFWTVSLEEYQAQIEAMGGEIVRFMANHTHIVRMPAGVAEKVAKLPYVRWTGPFHPAYKVSAEIMSGLVQGMPESVADYSVEVFDRGADQQNVIADAVIAAGGRVTNTNEYGYRMTVSLTPSQILALIARDELHYIDAWGPGEVDTDLAKMLNGVTAGANIANLGFTGNDVRGEIFDTGIANHPDLRPRLQHNGGGGGGHGTSVAGIPSGNGTNGGPTGFAPDRPVVIWTNATGGPGVGSSQFGGPFSRHLHTAELVDPNDQFQAVWQTSSVGSPRTRVYNTISAETDDYLFISQLLSTQSMSNAGLTPDVRPQAWAKNIVGVGGVVHGNNLNKLDDTAAGSTGPAQDGRIKPDLTHHYDNIWTTSGSSGYTTQFGGTSGATPTTVGNFALLFEMWQQEVFPGHGDSTLSVFAARPKMTTAKAMMINQADRYDWNSGGPNASFWRDRQGWGMATVGNLYTNRNKMMIQDEPGPILPLETHSFDFDVPNGEPTLFVTMTYADPMGPTSANQHRINDLSLRVTSPSGTVYWGNNGLRDSNFSTPGGISNSLDTVENVFINAPAAGTWVIEVIADEIVQDGHVETPALDADYSVVASGGQEVLGVAIRPVTPLPNLVLPGTPVDMTVSIVAGNSSILPNSEEGHYRLSAGAFTTVPLTPLGNNEFMMTVPAADCGQVPEFYFSAGDVGLGTTVFLPRAGAAAPFTYDIGELATTIEFSQGFEGGSLPSGWTATGLWNITSSCSPATPCDGTFFAYFGRTSTCTYAIGGRATGSLTSPLISVPSFNPEGGSVLSYCYNYEREGNAAFDKAHVLINGELVDEPAPTNTWDTRQIDLASYAGQDIRVEFFFDTTDGFGNNFRGFQIDAVTVEVTDAVCGSCACACDFDTSTGQGVCDLFDFLAFQGAFMGADPCACDIDVSTGPGVCDLFDFLAFQGEFVSGCP